MSTKSESHDKLLQYGRADTVDEQVLACLHSARDLGMSGMIRDEISEHCGLLTSTTCGALDRLKRRGLVEENGLKRNDKTNRSVTVYRAKERRSEA